MYSKIVLITLAILYMASVHAEARMQVNGEIKNSLGLEVNLLYPSWDIGDLNEDDLTIEPEGLARFSFFEHAHQGQIDFALSAGTGSHKMACLYDIRYGNRNFIQGAVRLTGPHVWPTATSVGHAPATCSLSIDDWDYEKSMNVRFLIE